MTDEDFYGLKFELKAVKEALSKLEVQVRDIFGELKELAGKVSVSLEVDFINSQLKEVGSVNLQQQDALGKLSATLQGIQEVLAKSSDRGVAEAAKGLIINVAGGNQDSNFNGKVDRVGINSGSGTQSN